MSSISAQHLSFIQRLWLAVICFFRVLLDASFARHVHALTRGGDGQKDALALEPTEQPRSADFATVEPAAAGTTSKGVTSRTAGGAARTLQTNDGARGALSLLALLQRDGRLVDFLQQDITSFDDGQVGAAARVVHEGCRKALQNHMAIDPIRNEPEGSAVSLSSDFDARAVKLTGNVHGTPPYSGKLLHRGWRAGELSLPQTFGDHDSSILAPAEVEL